MKEKMFSSGPYGDAWRKGYSAISRHCNRYGKELNWTSMQEGIAQAILEGVEEGNMFDQVMEGEQFYRFCRRCVNAYNRDIYRVNESESLNAILDDNPRQVYAQSYIPNPEQIYLSKESIEKYKEHLLQQEYMAIKLTVAGYNQKEISEKLNTTIRKTRTIFKHIKTELELWQE